MYVYLYQQCACAWVLSCYVFVLPASLVSVGGCVRTCGFHVLLPHCTCLSEAWSCSALPLSHPPSPRRLNIGRLLLLYVVLNWNSCCWCCLCCWRLRRCCRHCCCCSFCQGSSPFRIAFGKLCRCRGTRDLAWNKQGKSSGSWRKLEHVSLIVKTLIF